MKIWNVTYIPQPPPPIDNVTRTTKTYTYNCKILCLDPVDIINWARSHGLGQTLFIQQRDIYCSSKKIWESMCTWKMLYMPEQTPHRLVLKTTWANVSWTTIIFFFP